jgi:alanyl-tRNA synthetase
MAVREEERFRRTLDAGHGLIESELGGLGKAAILSGDVAFRLHDTYGFPIELTEEIAAERDMSVDRDGFDAAMEAQRDRARAARKATVDADAAPTYRKLFDDVGPTEFSGYERTEDAGRILSLLREGEAVDEAAEGEEIEVYFDRTPFYAESGGQVGDTGSVVTETGSLRVTDTQFPVQTMHGHRATVTSGVVRSGQDATLTVDSQRRERIRKSHTGTHLLHWALRQVLGSHVQQAGSLVTDGRLRFDFSHYAAVEPDALAEVERTANDRVIENARVRAFELDRQEAEEMGALAFFGDKYGDRVRVVEAGTYSRELCGGTHVPTTGQVGPLVVVGESSVSEMRSLLESTAEALRTRPDRVAEAAATLAERAREQEARIAAFESQTRSGVAADLLETAEDVDGARLVVAVRPGLPPDELRSLAMQVRDRLGSGVAVLGAEREGKAGLVAVVTPDLVAMGLSAGELIRTPASIVGGGGSKDPELAQAGGSQGDRIEEALDEARRLVLDALRSR